MSLWPHPPTIPYQGTVAAWSLLPEAIGVVLNWYSRQHDIAQSECLCLLTALFIESDFPDCLGAGQLSWFFFQERKKRCCEHSLDQFKELVRSRMPIDRTIAVYCLFHQVNCEYEPVTLCTSAVWPIITECKYYHESLSEVIAWTNHIINGILFHLHLRLQCVARQFSLGYKHGEVFLLPQVRDEHTPTRVMTLSGSTMPSYYICLRSAAVIHFCMPFISSGAWINCYVVVRVVCTQISFISGFRDRTGLGAFGAFLVHIW